MKISKSIVLSVWLVFTLGCAALIHPEGTAVSVWIVGTVVTGAVYINDESE